MASNSFYLGTGAGHKGEVNCLAKVILGQSSLDKRVLLASGSED